MALDVFAAISNQFDPALTNGVTTVVSNVIAAAAPLMTAALTIYVIIWGIMTAFGYASMAQLVRAAGVAAAVSLLMTSAFFVPYIQTPFLTTIPNWIAGLANGGGGPVVAAGQFTQLWSAVLHQEAIILQQASGIFWIGARIQAAMVTMAIGLTLGITFLIFEIARWLMDLLVATVPFVLWLYLFKATRGVPERLFGKMVGFLVLDVLIGVLLQIVVSANLAFMGMAQANAGAGVDQQLATLADVFVFFFFGMATAIMCPMVAAYIGGGVGFNVAPVIRNVQNVAVRVLARR